jgi:hypothetical protein
MKPSFLPPPFGPRTRGLAAIATISLAAVLTSCSLSRPAPVKSMYLLDAAAPPAAAVQKTASLRIGVINVAAPFRGRSFTGATTSPTKPISTANISWRRRRCWARRRPAR